MIAQESHQFPRLSPAPGVSTPACSTTNMPTAGQHTGIILGNTSCALFAFNRQWLISRLPQSSSHGSPASLRAPPGRCATHKNCALPRQALTHRTAGLHGCLVHRSCLPTAGRIHCARERSVQTLHVSKRTSNMPAVLRSLCSSTRSNAVHRLARRTPGRNAYQTCTNSCQPWPANQESRALAQPSVQSTSHAPEAQKPIQALETIAPRVGHGIRPWWRSHVLQSFSAVSITLPQVHLRKNTTVKPDSAAKAEHRMST